MPVVVNLAHDYFIRLHSSDNYWHTTVKSDGKRMIEPTQFRWKKLCKNRELEKNERGVRILGIVIKRARTLYALRQKLENT